MTTTNDYPVWRQRLSFILDFLIVFELIINTHSVYYFALDRDYYTLYVLTGLICLQLVVLPTVFAWEHLKKLLPVAVAWSAYIIIYAVVSGGDIKRLLAKFIILLVMLFDVTRIVMGTAIGTIIGLWLEFNHIPKDEPEDKPSSDEDKEKNA